LRPSRNYGSLKFLFGTDSNETINTCCDCNKCKPAAITCSANADSLGINKDCDNHPVSQYGMDTITAFSQYKTESKKFKDALTAFCNKGKTMGDMGFAANAHSLAEARKWTDSSLPGEMKSRKIFSSHGEPALLCNAEWILWF
jgi:hypothetical protein